MDKMEVTRLGDELVAHGIENGASKSFMMPTIDDVVQSDVVFSISEENARRRTKLEQHLRVNAALPLPDFQLQSIVNTVYRPSEIEIHKVATRRCRRRGNQDYTVNAKVVYGDSDIGSTVINDLMAGSGKSIMTMVASLYFTTHRSQEVVAREQILLREQRPMNWSSRIGVYDSPRSYTNAVIVMASDKVVAQWEKAAKQACDILGIRDVNIYRNPDHTDDDIKTTIKNNINIFLFTSAMNLKTFFPSDDGFVPCVVVDEYVVKSPHNIVTRKSHDTPIYGRLVLVSADAGDTSAILLGSRRSALMRSVLGLTNGFGESASLKNDVRLSAQLLACTVLPSKARQEAHDFLVSGLNTHRVEKYTLYFDSPLWGNEDSMEGYTTAEIPTFLKELGVNGLSNIKTVDELLQRFDDTLAESSGQNTTPFQRIAYPTLCRLKRSTKNQLREDCAVCLDPLKQQHKEHKDHIALLCPCGHMFCKPCMRRCLDARNTCPVCREPITGIMEARVRDEKKTSEEKTSEETTSEKTTSKTETFEGYFRKYLANKPSALEVCTTILNANAAALLAEDDIFDTTNIRILIVGPSTGFGLALYKSLERQYRDIVTIVQLKVEGNKRKRTSMGYEEQLAWFKSQEEREVVKVLCTHENVNFAEDVVGLDLHEVDAICHVGGGITGRRLGRVGRIQRAINAEEKVVRLFNILPSYN